MLCILYVCGLPVETNKLDNDMQGMVDTHRPGRERRTNFCLESNPGIIGERERANLVVRTA